MGVTVVPSLTHSVCFVVLRTLAFPCIGIIVEVEIFQLFGCLEFIESLRNMIVLTNYDVENISELFSHEDSYSP